MSNRSGEFVVILCGVGSIGFRKDSITFVEANKSASYPLIEDVSCTIINKCKGLRLFRSCTEGVFAFQKLDVFIIDPSQPREPFLGKPLPFPELPGLS